MADIPLSIVIGSLVFLVFLSAFFSAAEIAMVSLNRHRLKHLADSGHRGARIAQKLLARPDRLIGVILLGSNTINALFSSLTTYTVIQFWGKEESAIAIATVIITLVVLILTDLAPKTLAALHPERIAFPSAFMLRPLLWLIYPVVWVINGMANSLLWLLGVRTRTRSADQVSPEELRTIIMEAGILIPQSHQNMLLAILDLEKVTVDDLMVPRGKIEGVNLDEEWDDILSQITGSRYTRLPVYRGSLDNVTGMIHVRRVLNLMREDNLTKESLEQAIIEPYFIPSGTTLTMQLLNFRKAKRRAGLVVDEYGDIQGLVVLDEILEEIVGDFTAKTIGRTEDIHPESDGSYLINGSAHLRDINRQLGWNLPTDESRTLNGLIVEYLEDIPEPGTSLMIHGFQVEILRTRGTAIEIARVRPAPMIEPENDSDKTPEA